MYANNNLIILFLLIVVLFGFLNIKSVKKYKNKNSFADGNILCKIIHSNGSRWLLFKNLHLEYILHYV